MCLSLLFAFFEIVLLGYVERYIMKNNNEVKAKKANITNLGNCVVSFVKAGILERNNTTIVTKNITKKRTKYVFFGEGVLLFLFKGASTSFLELMMLNQRETR